MNKGDIFSRDYVGEDQTDINMQVSDEKGYSSDLEEIPEKDYEISKPRRIIIRGRLINGKS